MNIKKISIITCIILIPIIIFLVVFILIKPKSITSIIDKKTLDRISYVTCSNNNDVSASAMLADFKESSFKSYSGDLGSTVPLTFTFLDANNNILFQYIEIGNNNIIEFKINGKSKYYIKNGVLR